MNKSYVAALAALVVVCLSTNVGTARAQSIPSPWSAADIGGPALPGSATFASGVLQVDAAGEDVWNESDEFHFVYQAVSGDIDVRARVDSMTAAHAWSKGGVMIRSSLAADAIHGFALVSAGKGVAFQRRHSTGGLSTHTAGPLVAASRWVRLVRAGASVTAYTSADGARWAVIGSDTIALGATAYVGVAVTSHNTGMRTTASLSDLAVTAAGLPSAQASADISAPAIAGSASFAAGAYTIRAGGRDIWDLSDQFHYVYQPVTGNVEVIARVASLTAAHRWSKAGVMIRESLAPGSRHAMALASAASGYAFQRRSETGAWSDHTDGGAGTAPGWVRLVRTAARVEAYRSVDGLHWVSMGSAAVNLADTVYVGIALTSHDVAVAATAVIDSFRITESAAAVNKPPSVILNVPTNGAGFTAPATLTVSAAATDSDGTIAAVEFYANSTLISRDTSAPYAATVSSTAAGTYVLKAVPTDDLGASTISESVTVTVTEPAPESGTAPLGIAFTASADHATLVTKYVLEVYKSGATPGATSPVAISSLGKPAPTSTGEITVDRSAFFAALAPGSYIATVVAVGDGGSGRSGTVSFTR
ncbi:hypothetical protein BH24ACI5_BH24ACI5_02630 [soil metagenome]